MPITSPPRHCVHARARVLNRAKVEEARDVAAKQREQLHRQRPAAFQHTRTYNRRGGGGMMSISIS